MSTQTRPWKVAARIAQSERDKCDPIKIELQKIAESEAAKETALQAGMKPPGDALKQWLAGMKSPGETSLDTYRSTTCKILRWAGHVGVTNVSDVIPALLDDWRSSWSPDASKESESRLALTTQATLLTHVEAFFRWATATEYISKNPALMLKAVTPDESDTWPLTPKQFEELLAATDNLDAASRYESRKVGQHLRAIFLVQGRAHGWMIDVLHGQAATAYPQTIIGERE